MERRINNLDLLRLILALEVVTGHFSVMLGFANQTYWPLNPVPCFVALSGALIPASFERSNAWGHFAWKRFLRVMPAFALSLLLVLWVFGSAALWPTLACYVTLGLLDIGKNGVLWSLMLEECLYTSHAIARLRGFWKAEYAAVALGACLAASVTLDTLYKPWEINTVDRIARAAAAYFAGNVLYFNRAKIQNVNGWLALAGVIITGYLGIVTKSTSPVFALMIVATAVLAVVAALRLPQIPKIPDLSYGLYIFHMPILAVAIACTHGHNVSAFTVGLLGSLAGSALSWYLVESQALRWKDRLPRLGYRAMRRTPPDLAKSSA